MVHSELSLPSDEPEQLLIKSDAETDPAYGKKPTERNVEELLKSGVINLDKVAGPTSHEVVSWVRKILCIKNCGHGGTLDPGVTGVLPVALGRATRVLSALLNAGKEYVCVMYLHKEEPQARIEKILKVFTGQIYQRPPMKSSVKRRVRVREIYYIHLLEVKDRYVLFRVGCEAGTYIRKLCFDIGEALTSGAHMLELRRTRVGNFKEDNSLVTLQNIKDAFTLYQQENEDVYLKHIISPMEQMVSHMPKIYVRDTAVDAICHGADLASAGICNLDARIKVDDRVALMSLKGELIGFGIAKRDAMSIYKAKTGIMVASDKVFMKRETYPRWDNKSAITT
ncbi:MAG: putative tRNA pseudouridine synthase B [Promethearchaeota archaeon]|nr:MAG: putative tRNA pseudouridine synthase B [Candidatus Lokiarchaeota archaeon]